MSNCVNISCYETCGINSGISASWITNNSNWKMLPNFVFRSQNDGNFPKFIQSRASSLKSSVNSDWDVATSPFLDSSLHAFKTPKFWKKKNSPIFLRKSRAFSSVQSTRNEHVRNEYRVFRTWLGCFSSFWPWQLVMWVNDDVPVVSWFMAIMAADGGCPPSCSIVNKS